MGIVVSAALLLWIYKQQNGCCMVRKGTVAYMCGCSSIFCEVCCCCSLQVTRPKMTEKVTSVQQSKNATYRLSTKTSSLVPSSQLRAVPAWNPQGGCKYYAVSDMPLN